MKTDIWWYQFCLSDILSCALKHGCSGKRQNHMGKVILPAVEMKMSSVIIINLRGGRFGPSRPFPFGRPIWSRSVVRMFFFHFIKSMVVLNLISMKILQMNIYLNKFKKMLPGILRRWESCWHTGKRFMKILHLTQQ